MCGHASRLFIYAPPCGFQRYGHTAGGEAFDWFNNELLKGGKAPAGHPAAGFTALMGWFKTVFRLSVYKCHGNAGFCLYSGNAKISLRQSFPKG